MAPVARKIPTPREINEQQKRDAEVMHQQKAVPATPGTAVTPGAKPTPPTVDPDALERHLAAWAGPGGRLYAFNGSAGHHRLLDDGTEMPAGQLFRAHLAEYHRGYIKFNPDAPPTVVMVGLGENAELPSRESLGDNDPRKWPISELTSQPDDPWKLQVTFPIISCDDAAELYLYVARGVVALNAVDGLLGRWRHHPKRRQGSIPIVQINNGTYYSKKFGCDRPKPEFKITGWASADDAPPPQAQIKAPFDDEIPY
jgi:hypothetical protein